jgi:hypothetical protein
MLALTLPKATGSAGHSTAVLSCSFERTEFAADELGCHAGFVEQDLILGPELTYAWLAAARHRSLTHPP